MASGADNSGDDMVVGRTNRSEERTILVAQNGDNAPDGYAEDFVLSVSTVGDKVLPTNSHGVDAIHAKGTVAFPTGVRLAPYRRPTGLLAKGSMASSATSIPQRATRVRSKIPMPAYSA